MPATGAIHVIGLNGMLRAFGQADKTLRSDMKEALQEAAAPVRSAAQAKAMALPAGRDWSAMRIGAYTSIVYVAPVERGLRQGRRKRPSFGVRLMERAMQPALEENSAVVERRLEGLVDDVIGVWERAAGG